MDEAVIGVDIGSSRIKAIAYGRNGVALREVAVATPVDRRAGFQDFPIVDMVAAARSALARLAQDTQVRGIGIASMGEVGTIVAEGALTPLSFPSWHDTRGDQIVERLRDLARALDAHTATGGHFRTVSTVAKLGWVAQRHGVEPGMFLNVASALAWTLTAHCTQDASLAVTSGVHRPADGGVLHELWVAAGLSSVLLAPIAPAGTAFAAVSSSAQLAGIPGGIPVVVAGHDHPVAAVGTGAPDDAVVDSLGTGEPLIARFSDRRAPASSQARPFPQEGFSVETSPSTGELIAIAEGLRPGLAMNALVAASSRQRGDLDAQIDLDVEDILDPADVLALEAGEVRLPADEHTWSALHAHFVARATRSERAVRELTRAAGPTVLTGGGLRSSAWVEMKARAARSPLLVSTATETAARGAAALAGTAAHWWDTPEAMPGATLLTVGEWLRSRDTSA